MCDFCIVIIASVVKIVMGYGIPHLYFVMVGYF